MSKKSRDKGYRIERELAQKLTAAGIPSARQMGSGAFGGIDKRLAGDIRIGIMPDDTHLLTGESKGRANGEGFKTIERWLADNDVLLLRRDRKDPLVVFPWHVALHILRTFYEDELETKGIYPCEFERSAMTAPKSDIRPDETIQQFKERKAADIFNKAFNSKKEVKDE